MLAILSGNYNDLSTKIYQKSHQSKLEILRCLYENGADIHLKDSMGDNILDWVKLNSGMLGCETCEIDYLKTLIGLGANINQIDKSGHPIIYDFCARYSHQGIQSLITVGADIHQKTSNEHGNILHFLASQEFCDKEMIRFLVSQGVSINEIDTPKGSSVPGWPPLAFVNRKENTEIFLNAGANPLFIDGLGQNLLQILHHLNISPDISAPLQPYINNANLKDEVLSQLKLKEEGNKIGRKL
jgi:ankyrin repeat protein